ncbi:lecithin retinol acyltransferase family protein [Nannocystis pusilla]|uniref:lecithin retinol acyltransferase family protein n=1 Tax=Nannocystis pusilla TaxID=889268 RepID=UPI003B77F5FE
MLTRPEFRPGLILVRDVIGFSPLLHYGVWAEEDKVIHAQKALPAAIVATSFDGFAEGKVVGCSNFYNRMVTDPAKTIERALSAVGPWPYHYEDKNCEAFVYWCATGQHWKGVQAAVFEVVGKVATIAMGGTTTSKNALNLTGLGSKGPSGFCFQTKLGLSASERGT